MKNVLRTSLCCLLLALAATEAAAKKRYQSYVRKTQEDWSL